MDVGTSVIPEFSTPFVPKGHDFLKEIKKLTDSRQEVQAACEAKAVKRTDLLWLVCRKARQHECRI